MKNPIGEYFLKENEPAPAQEATLTKKKWKLPAAIAVLAFIVGIGAGSGNGIPQSELDTANATITTLTGERDTALGELTELKANAEAEQARIDSANKDIEDQKAEIEQTRGELETLQGKLEEREKAVSGEEQKAQENTFGPGRWIVGEDIKPGTYKTTEPVTSDRCYWAITKSGSNGDDIYSNDYGTQGNHTVTLKKGQDFESTNCGDWKLSK